MAKKTTRDWKSILGKVKETGAKKKGSKDERVFVPTVNDANIAKVEMRFIASEDEDVVPLVREMKHWFQDDGGYYVENCPNVLLDKPKRGVCPVCDDMWKNNYYETDKPLYDERSANTYFYTNVLIVDDKNSPVNNGKVFLFKFGKKIKDKLDECIEEGKNPYAETGGVNFKFVMKKNGKQTSYDASSFTDKETDLEDYAPNGNISEILKQCHSLDEWINTDNYKSYSELKTRYVTVIGETIEDDEDKPSKPKEKPQRTKKVETVVEDDDEDDDDVSLDVDMSTDDDDDDDFFNDLEDDE